MLLRRISLTAGLGRTLSPGRQAARMRGWARGGSDGSDGVDGWMGGWADERMSGWADGRMGGWPDGRMGAEKTERHGRCGRVGRIGRTRTDADRHGLAWTAY